MSRIGKKAIPIPEGVKVSIQANIVQVTGPKGTVKEVYPASIKVEVDEQNKVIKVSRPDDEKKSKAYQGLTRALINNAVVGVTTGFQKNLEIFGTGYNARLKGKQLEIQIGYTQPQIVPIPEGITAEVPSPIKIVLKSANKQLLGQFTENVRAIRFPDSYKGKGIRFEGEVLKLKQGKSFTSGG